MSLRSALRAQTADCHAAVDTFFGSFNLSRIQDYRAFLRAHARVVPAIEHALENGGIGRLLPDWPERRRAHLLAADIRELDDRLPVLLPQPSLRSEAAVWGAAYVLEGSKLGGALLAKAVPDYLPHSYLSPQGPKGAMRLFMDRLDASTVDDPSLAAAAARDVFELFLKAGQVELEAVP
ncbi:biliverdin-producing heme oxygenase [Rhizobium leguminosarum]|uniref:biliverdin-producing heme oxygenase n=1 Tax=Rhizobium leguminosarum TaxID=384 RepID=UPI0013DC6472|nr:biliverdin-producing heme oxygenase [Rhizobium leguminosarum]NEK36048.1 biliverdin-producing heme oxygenase [Rhizobium leguminosarum]NKL07652.1 biliverdin-producing heme oxygenase [Rhizobium leguminosarum bv. viciae]NKL87814.1 biliverdin-producing heme oxygenase [Rhizobium leguminosarum bv. viciae]NKL93625.1 biliverdin-producing heme oxygenase [Rhizobium leguminosarum bv. viciae]NKM94640.1 biliverdin-producing heme oxygenase [Rhizobium leguminosarum bv. viciae]